MVHGAWVRSQIIRRRESLVLYKSFNTLWLFSYRILMNKDYLKECPQQFKLLYTGIEEFNGSTISFGGEDRSRLLCPSKILWQGK
jgi:hypothetical protein